MKLLLKSVKILDDASPWNGQVHDLYVCEGRIEAVDGSVDKGAVIIEGTGLCVSPGWMDLRAHFCDPGEEYKEDIVSGVQAALAGGFTDVALMPNTKPVLQDKSQLDYVQACAKGLGVTLHVFAALTRDLAGKQLNDLYELHQAGACGFTQGDLSLEDAHVLTQALRYVAPFGGLIVNVAADASLSALGYMHEGLTSTQLGLPSIPTHAETLALQRDLTVLQYTQGRLHAALLSSAAGVALIAAAKKNQLAISCDTAWHQLLFDDTVLQNFDTQYKVLPPYRSKADRLALCAAVADGCIDAIVSNHYPQETDAKMTSFAQAAYGVIALEVALPMLLSIQGDLPLTASLRALYRGPREVLGIPVPRVALGEAAILTVFDTEQTWTWDKSNCQSRSLNSPWFGKRLQGRVRAVINQDHIFLQPAS